MKINGDKLILVLAVLLYMVYFSWISVVRYQTLHAHYFDLGIMNQTVHNTYQSIRTGDWSRFLEMTNPHGMGQVKRMSVHNDILLALLAPFYFIYSGPEMLLVIQSVALGLGAFAVYALAEHVFRSWRTKHSLPLLFSLAYLMYPPLQFTNLFDFHAVAIATPLLLYMMLFYIQRKFATMLVMALAAILAKEQVGLTVAFFGFYVLVCEYIRYKNKKHHCMPIGFAIIVASFLWFIISMTVIIPHFRTSAHFAIGYFGDFGESTKDILIGILLNPQKLFPIIFRNETFDYLSTITSPLGFLSFFSPLIAIAIPELGINIISNKGAMRNIFFHYTAVITPFVFISALYGFRNIVRLLRRERVVPWFLVAVLVVPSIYFSITTSPLPYSPKSQIQAFTSPRAERNQVLVWQEKLSDESIRVSASGTIAPLFSSRRYLYEFAQHSYTQADYVVLSTDDVYNGYQNHKSRKHYKALLTDDMYKRIVKDGDFEVYKRL